MPRLLESIAQNANVELPEAQKWVLSWDSVEFQKLFEKEKKLKLENQKLELEIAFSNNREAIQRRIRANHRKVQAVQIRMSDFLEKYGLESEGPDTDVDEL